MKSRAITTILGLFSLTMFLFFLGCEGNGSFIDSEKGIVEYSRSESGDRGLAEEENGPLQNIEGIFQESDHPEEDEESDAPRTDCGCNEFSNDVTLSDNGVVFNLDADDGTQTIIRFKEDGDTKMSIYSPGSNEDLRIYSPHSGVGTIMTFDHDTGRVGIGDTSPAYDLSVHGTIQAEEVIVEQFTPDYVFGENYDLWTPEEIEVYIEEEQHLPGVPSADDIAAHGVSLGDQQAVLLQKVEELTLHMIEQNKRLKKQEKTIAELQVKVSKKMVKN